MDPGASAPSDPAAATPLRGGRRRDRRGRGARGPRVLTGPLSASGVRRQSPGAGARFDQLALDLLGDLERRWPEELHGVEVAVEDAPMVPDDWTAATVPLSSLVRGAGRTPTRVVLFRRPLELRAESRSELTLLVHTVLVEQVAELLGLPPEQVDPRYEDPEDPEDP